MYLALTRTHQRETDMYKNVRMSFHWFWQVPTAPSDIAIDPPPEESDHLAGLGGQGSRVAGIQRYYYSCPIAESEHECQHGRHKQQQHPHLEFKQQQRQHHVTQRDETQQQQQ